MINMLTINKRLSIEIHLQQDMMLLNLEKSFTSEQTPSTTTFESNSIIIL